VVVERGSVGRLRGKEMLHNQLSRVVLPLALIPSSPSLSPSRLAHSSPPLCLFLLSPLLHLSVCILTLFLPFSPPFSLSVAHLAATSLYTQRNDSLDELN